MSLFKSPKTKIEGEVWAIVDGFENYEISTLGRVYSRKFKRIMSPSIRQDNGRSVKLRVTAQKPRSMKIHRLVAQAFIPNPENKPEIDHLDNNPSNNNVHNLQWCTRSENIKLSYDRGRDRKGGEQARTSKVSNEDANMIRFMYSRGNRVAYMSQFYNLSENSVRSIIKNRTYVS